MGTPDLRFLGDSWAPAASLLYELLCDGPSTCVCQDSFAQREGATHCPLDDPGRTSLTVRQRRGRLLLACSPACPSRPRCGGLRQDPHLRPPRAPSRSVALHRALDCEDPHCSCHAEGGQAGTFTHCPAHPTGRPTLFLGRRRANAAPFCYLCRSSQRSRLALKAAGLWPIPSGREEDPR